MSWIVTVLVFILILGIIVFVHELGHFLWAKKFGVFIHEFSIGMGPVIYTKKGKDGINYNVRLFPIGGFVSMAGEVYEDDDNVPKERCLCNKPVWQRLIVMAAGVVNNFILAIILFFIMGLFWGSHKLTPIIDSVDEGLPMAEAGIVKGDRIIGINGHKIRTWDEAQIVFEFKNTNEYDLFKIKHADGTIDEYKITPVEVLVDGEKVERFGVSINQDETFGIWNKIKYGFEKFASIVSSMLLTVWGLISGKISINALSGPVGIYGVVDQTVNLGINYVIFLVAYLSVNVGVINILPFPAFDGGRIFFLIIEKIIGKPVNRKFENICHTIGFILLILLVIYVTIHDVGNLFH